MKILVWHGYLLTGSGSNIYTANVARVWRNAGHDVLLMCQEHKAGALEFVDGHGDFSSDNDGWDLRGTDTPTAPGRCRVVRPHIGEVLPVYVYDEYEGFVAKRFVDLDDDELSAYTKRNTAAMVTAIEAFEPDVIITGHEVMGPFIALQACEQTGTRYTVKLHGSALEYAVKLQDRYRIFATEGLNGAGKVVGGSEYMLRAAAEVVPGWIDRASVVNPGCDVDLFKPVQRSEPAGPDVAFVGKLIVSKGVHNFLASLGLTRVPRLQATIVGYGGFERDIEDLAGFLQGGDKESALELAERGDGLALAELVTFLRSNETDEAYLARAADVPVRFTGRLEHDPLSRLLPTVDLLVVPSVLAEAFGMVAAEAAACGVLPIVPDHSGISEAGRAIEEGLGEPGLLTFDSLDPIHGISARIDAILSRPFEKRREMGMAAADLARRLWSWEKVGEKLLSVAAGA